MKITRGQTYEVTLTDVREALFDLENAAAELPEREGSRDLAWELVTELIDWLEDIVIEIMSIEAENESTDTN